ncbi:hypothetical protein CR513_12612, partial [Mucuna pruriens]
SVRLCSVRLHLAKTVSDKALSSPYRTSLYQEQLGTKPRFSHKVTIEHTMSLREFDLGSSTNPMYELDPEIELTLRRLRKSRNIVESNSSNFDSVSSSDNNNSTTNSSDSVEYSSTNIFEELG